ncbi:DUF4179 domain-containing protein [Paenibacillus sp. 7124]|uniref:DUF4179 domain-containing protein n=1 Tax=Paenibacillus apii TaxID=1850370 RepID=A0A6M1PUC0_9BACL|nr:DUF4179 domain-containing protein [Paenibacillus apii]NGM85313.1 DUF4179 domain-containing protein [Paenibacillus apii]NJJ41814.1 DUF4179 domain-containing protein [Paenibacillus apii]
MTMNREERAMLAEAADLHGSRPHGDDAIQMRDIEEAIRRAGERVRKRRRAGGLAAAVVTAAVAAGLFAGPGSLLPAAFQATEAGPASDVPKGLAPFFSWNPDAIPSTLTYAWRHRYVQPLDVKASQDGYGIVVHGVIADRNQIMLLYTATSAPNREIYGISNLKLSSSSTGAAMGNGNYGSYSNQRERSSLQSYRGISKISLDPAAIADRPSRIWADFQIGAVPAGRTKGWNHSDMSIVKFSPRLKVAIDLDPRFWQAEPVTALSEQTVTIQGHAFRVKLEAYPISTKVTFLMDDTLLKDADFKKSFVLSNELQFSIYTRDKGNREVQQIGSQTGGWMEEGFQFVMDSRFSMDKPKSVRLNFPKVPGTPDLIFNLSP